ncbi:MAG: dTMP kinase [Candidatus Omnitrophica bacterium]|nr:dTMP kinase [Candidatus Omnitrophota bacterium]
MARRGVFITLEGPEGSGKSSQARWLVQRLRRAGHRVTLVRDPGSTALGRSLRRALLHTSAELSPLAEALLFIGGRVQLVEERIRPALAKGRVVVCDRFHDSTVAYQGFGGQLDVPWLDRVGRAAIRRVMPDVTVLLDVPTAVGFARLRRSRDRMERKALAFHRRVRAGFLRLAKREPKRFVVIDASQPAAAVRREIEMIVSSEFGVRSSESRRALRIPHSPLRTP